MNKHTPGPWFWERRMLVSRQQYRPGYVAEIMVCHCEIDEQPNESDARLISMAPDMLAALKDVFALMDEGFLVRNIVGDEKPDWAVRLLPSIARLKKALDVIEKAEGK